MDILPPVKDTSFSSNLSIISTNIFTCCIDKLKIPEKKRRRSCFSPGSSFKIQFRRHVDLIRDIPAVLFPLTHALGEQILDLPVHRAEVILRPCGNGVVKLRVQTERDLFFGSAISTGCRCSQWAERHGCRRAPPAGWRPLLPCAHRQAPPPCFHSDVPAPFPPCRPHHPRSSCGRR